MPLKDKIAKAMELLQHMEIQATATNVRAVDFALITMEEVYKALDEKGKGDGNGTD